MSAEFEVPPAVTVAVELIALVMVVVVELIVLVITLYRRVAHR